MNSLVIDYFNCENGVLVLKREYFEDYEEFKKANRLFDELISLLIGSVKITYFKGENKDIIFYISEEDRNLLNSILAIPVTDEDLKNSEEKSKRLYHGLCKINVGAFAGAIGNDYYDYAYNLLRTSKKSFDKKGFLEREFHDTLEYYSEKEVYLIRERDCTEEERKYVEGVMELYPNEMEYILPSKQLIK